MKDKVHHIKYGKLRVITHQPQPVATAGFVVKFSALSQAAMRGTRMCVNNNDSNDLSSVLCVLEAAVSLEISYSHIQINLENANFICPSPHLRTLIAIKVQILWGNILSHTSFVIQCE